MTCNFKVAKGNATGLANGVAVAGDKALAVELTSADGSAGGSVPATLSLTLGTPASFGAFTPGVTRTYESATTANVISTAGDATLSVADPSAIATGHLVNGTFFLPELAPGPGAQRRQHRHGVQQRRLVGLTAEPADLQRPDLQRRGRPAVQPADQVDRRAPYRRVQQDADLHALHHHPVEKETQ